MGSSPLTRGKHFAELKQLIDRGLIPAHAGKTSAMASLASLFGAHPRSRGENLGVSGERFAETGSSPLTRGKPYGWDGDVLLAGLIPAHAGKTSSLVSPFR